MKIRYSIYLFYIIYTYKYTLNISTELKLDEYSIINKEKYLTKFSKYIC